MLGLEPVEPVPAELVDVSGSRIGTHSFAFPGGPPSGYFSRTLSRRTLRVSRHWAAVC